MKIRNILLIFMIFLTNLSYAHDVGSGEVSSSYINRLYSEAGIPNSKKLEATENLTCHQSSIGKLRVGYDYTFKDSVSNHASDIIIADTNTVFTTHGQYDVNKKAPTFNYTSEFLNTRNYFKKGDFSKYYPLSEKPSDSVFAGYRINKGTNNLFMLASDLYTVQNYPAKRRFDNLTIVYTMKKYPIGGKKIETHNECKYYEVSWCGDGVLDTNYGETCDSNDISHKSWGTGGCSKTCEAIN